MDEVSFHNEDQTNEDVAVESEPSHLPLGVSIRGLVKVNSKTFALCSLKQLNPYYLIYLPNFRGTKFSKISNREN